MMASAISVMAIIVLNFFYDILARKLTEIELPRTQQQFDDSFSFKVFCFQFVNYNSTLFYIAFFKDTLTGYPGNPTTIELDGRKYRWAGCDGGCSYELAFQLIFTMVARQTYQNVFEVYLPWIIQKYKKWTIGEEVQKENGRFTRWELDYVLQSSKNDHSDEIVYGKNSFPKNRPPK